MKSFALLLVGIIACGITTPASAAIVTDQEQTFGDDAIAIFFNGELAQGFQPSTDNIIGASLKLAADSTVPELFGNVSIDLYDAIDIGTRSLLGTGTKIGARQNELVAVTFGSMPITVVPDRSYFLVFRSTNGTLGIAGSGTNPYARGQAFLDQVASPTADFRFSTQTVVAIPEPSSLALGGFGVVAFAAAGFYRRRKRVANC